jgi:hypothetical protein
VGTAAILDSARQRHAPRGRRKYLTRGPRLTEAEGAAD